MLAMRVLLAATREIAGGQADRSEEIFSRMGATGRLAQLPAAGGGGGLEGSMIMGGSLLASTVGGANKSVGLKTIFDLNRELSTMTDLRQLLDKLVAAVEATLGVRCAVIRRQDDKITCAAASGFDPSEIDQGKADISMSVFLEALSTGEMVVSSSAQTDERLLQRRSIMAHDIRSVICVPLKTNKGVYGCLYIDSVGKARTFSRLDSELAFILATQAASAIENADLFSSLQSMNVNLDQLVQVRTSELEETNANLTASMEELKNTKLALAVAQRDALEKELSIARTIQETILPPATVSRHGGISVFGRTRPAFYCAGDLWFHSTFADGRRLVFVGDVTGHGAGAAMVSTAVKAAAEALDLTSPTLDPMQFLTTLSRVIRQTTQDKLRMTAILCVVDPNNAKVDIWSAAHEVPLFFEHAGGLARIRQLNLPPSSHLGASGDTHKFTHCEAPLSPGDRLLLFTDGIKEATNDRGRAYGAKKMASKMLADMSRPVDEWIDGLLTDVESYSGSVQIDDDCTAVAIEFTDARDG